MWGNEQRGEEEVEGGWNDGITLTCITLMLSPVSCASCSLIWRVGLGVAANAAFRVSNCLALMVVLGPLLLAPLTGIPAVFSFSLFSSPASWLLLLLLLLLLFMMDASLTRSKSSGVVAGVTPRDGEMASLSASRRLMSSVLGLSGGELESWLERAVLQEPGGLLKWSLSGSSGLLTVYIRTKQDGLC